MVQLNVMPLSPRQAGARAGLLDAIVARNFGCTQLIVEHDCADLGEGATAEPCYGQYTVIDTVEKHARELGIEVVPLRNLIHEEDRPERSLVGPTAARRASRADIERSSEIARSISYPRVLQEYQKPSRKTPRK